MRSFPHGAKQKIKSTPLSTIGVMLRMSRMMMAARLNGSYRNTPFFDIARGEPVVTPTVLTSDERARVMRAV